MNRLVGWLVFFGTLYWHKTASISSMQSVALLTDAQTSQILTDMADGMANIANLISIMCTMVLSLIKMTISTLMSHLTRLH